MTDLTAAVQDLRKKFKSLLGLSADISTLKSNVTTLTSNMIESQAPVTNLRIVVYDGTTGKKIKDGGKTIAQLSASSGGISQSLAIAYAVAL